MIHGLPSPLWQSTAHLGAPAKRLDALGLASCTCLDRLGHSGSPLRTSYEVWDGKGAEAAPHELHRTACQAPMSARVLGVLNCETAESDNRLKTWHHSPVTAPLPQKRNYFGFIRILRTSSQLIAT